jgi:hypothetical protein
LRSNATNRSSPSMVSMSRILPKLSRAGVARKAPLG